MDWDGKWYSTLIPSEAELAKPDRWMKAMADWIRSRDDPGLATWAVEGLADDLDVPVVVVPEDRKSVV